MRADERHENSERYLKFNLSVTNGVIIWIR